MTAFRGWVWPVEAHPQTKQSPTISDGFGIESRGGAGHFGVDIMYRRHERGSIQLPWHTAMFTMPDGVYALACGPGVVKRVDPNEPHGLVVEIDHQKLSGAGRHWSCYRHLVSSPLRVGQPVAAGARVGVIGYDRTRAANKTPNHLHFELWNLDTVRAESTERRKRFGLDPEPLMDGWVVLGRTGGSYPPALSGDREDTNQDDKVSDETLLAEVEMSEMESVAVATALGLGYWYYGKG